MSEFLIVAWGETFDVDAYIAATSLPIDVEYVWRRGDQKRRSCVEDKHHTNGFEIILGDGYVISLLEQEGIAVEFLSSHREDLKTLAKYPGVDKFKLCLHYHLKLIPNLFGFSLGPSAWLIWHVLDIGVQFDYFGTFDRRHEHRDKQRGGPRTRRNRKQ